MGVSLSGMFDFLIKTTDKPQSDVKTITFRDFLNGFHLILSENVVIISTFQNFTNKFYHKSQSFRRKYFTVLELFTKRHRAGRKTSPPPGLLGITLFRYQDLQLLVHLRALPTAHLPISHVDDIQRTEVRSREKYQTVDHGINII